MRRAAANAHVVWYHCDREVPLGPAFDILEEGNCLMNKLLVVAWLCLLAPVFSSQIHAEDPDQIPIMAWLGVPPDLSTLERFKELRESGITHNFSHSRSIEQLIEAMDVAEKAGIKMIISVPELSREPEAVVRRVMGHPALAGYYLTDEPGRAAFPGLAERVRTIQAVDNKHFCYINLLPNHAPPAALGTDTYREHVQQFIQEVPVKTLSFDHYPITEDAEGNRRINGVWYENLEIISDEARKAKKPFWAFALTVAHFTYPIPTPAELRLQVFSNLAYGAQGIQYFTYVTPTAYGQNDFHHAPLAYGTYQRTEVFDYLKEVNQEIASLSRVFLDSTVVSVAHTGEHIPPGTQPLGKLPDVIHEFETQGEGAVVSILKKESKYFLVIVNRDFQNSMTVKLEGEPELKRVLKDGSEVDAKTYINTLPVGPGDVLIYAWQGA